ncbi:unnamed protein product [Fusarium venenatum]|uniref:Uncharacterized protein n=1 Tax=Fusarium venenatum TaxID=56646 RepID=A0A2L2SU48_9HYPO|nr:uncharacterized protein FVRRES_05348 [Fusarium venenatum]CEI60912.1 unnamed protein product [Fusarium venenatum]
MSPAGTDEHRQSQEQQNSGQGQRIFMHGVVSTPLLQAPALRTYLLSSNREFWYLLRLNV